MDMRAAAGQIFAASIHDDDDAMLARRRQAAAALSAPLTPMSELLSDDSERPRFGHSIERMQLRDCADEALRLAREGRRPLFLTSDATLIAKALQRALASAGSAESKGASVQQECLALVQLRQCRDVFELLRVVAAVDARTNEHHQLHFISVGPLARLFSPFETTSGLTVGGEGLHRALHLALKRLRATSGAAVCTLEPDDERDDDSPAMDTPSSGLGDLSRH